MKAQQYEYESYDPRRYYSCYPELYSIHQSYYFPDVSTPPHPTSILLPGVPLSFLSQPTQLPVSRHYHFQGGGSQGDPPTKGRGSETFGRQEAGRGEGRGNHASSRTSVSAATKSVKVAPSKVPSQIPWCELCRICFPTLENLEQHKNGKKHLQRERKEMQNMSKHLTVLNQLPEAPPVSVVADGTLSSTAHPSQEGVGHKSTPFSSDLNSVVVAPSKVPSQIPWCEICRICCSTLEHLEQHKNKKKHLQRERNEMQSMSKHLRVPKQLPKAPPVSVVAHETLPSVAHPAQECVRHNSPPFRTDLNSVEVAPSKVPLQTAGCELCKVDCITPQNLKRRKKRKKHLLREKMERLGSEKMSKILTVENQQPEAPQVSVMADDTVSSIAHQSVESARHNSPSFMGGLDNIKVSPSKPPRQTFGNLEQHKNGKEHLEIETLLSEKMSKHLTAHNQEPEVPHVSVMADETVSSMAHPSKEGVGPDSYSFPSSLKRKMSGDHENDRFKRPFEPSKPEEVVLSPGELCNVECESQVVHGSHLAGEKYLSNLERYQGLKQVFGTNAETPHPTTPNLQSASVVPQANQQVLQHAQELEPVLLSNQNPQDPHALQSALTQLLNQHGIQDARALIAQLTPYLPTQAQPGSIPLPVPDLRTNAPFPQSRGSGNNLGQQLNEGQDAGHHGETKTEQCDGESGAGVGAAALQDDVPSKGGENGSAVFEANSQG